MKYGILFITLALLLIVTALLHQGWWLLLCYPAVSFMIVASDYLYFGTAIYGKSSLGVMLILNQILLFPYLVYLWLVWYLLRLVKREPAITQLTENVYIGRRLMANEFPNYINHVIDLTCEFTEPQKMRLASYHSFQILDGFVPTSSQLHDWVESVARLEGNIYIHCAEGHGRTGLFSALLLLHLNQVQTVEQAIDFIQSKRPLVRLGQRQHQLLHEIWYQ